MPLAAMIATTHPVSPSPLVPSPGTPSLLQNAATTDLAREQRVARIGYRLASAAHSLCDRPQAMTGMVVHDIAGYSERDRPAIAKAYGFGRGFGVRLVVPGGAAARAGIQQGDVIFRAADTDLESFATGLIIRRASSARTGRAVDLIEAKLAVAPVLLTIRRNGTLRAFEIHADPGCGGTFIVADGTILNAWSDGKGVAVTGRLVDMLGDDELAFALAHEMAHNILKHAALTEKRSGLLSELGVNTGPLKDAELAADAMGIRIATSAGFRGEGAESFLRKIARSRGPTIATTHPGFKLRIERLRSAMSKATAPTDGRPKAE